jgi:hypothetical protein
MFRTKPISYNVTITLKSPRIDNVLVNVVDGITSHNQH